MFLAEAAADPGWLDTVYSTLFDPRWNQQHAVGIWALILGILVLTGIGLPTPEDIWLTLAGFSTYKQADDTFVWYGFAGAFAACTVAILIGDIAAWWLGRRYGFAIRDRFKLMRRVLTDKRMKKVQGWFDNYGNWSVFFGRQVAGVRFVTFFTAGTMRVPLHKFTLFDFLGCLVSIPIWLTLGALASIYGREWLDRASTYVGSTLLVVFVLAVVVFLVVVKIRASRRAKLDQVALETEVRLASEQSQRRKAVMADKP